MTTQPVMGDPGTSGRFGSYGGRYLPEPLIGACAELEAAFRGALALAYALLHHLRGRAVSVGLACGAPSAPRGAAPGGNRLAWRAVGGGGWRDDDAARDGRPRHVRAVRQLRRPVHP